MSSMVWECTAADDGARLERLLRDKCRDLDPARRLSNRLIKEAIKQGEAFINGAVVQDKSRVLREGDTVELRYSRERASEQQAEEGRRLLQIEYDSADLAVVWKPAGVNRELEDAINAELRAPVRLAPPCVPIERPSRLSYERLRAAGTLRQRASAARSRAGLSISERHRRAARRGEDLARACAGRGVRLLLPRSGLRQAGHRWPPTAQQRSLARRASRR